MLLNQGRLMEIWGNTGSSCSKGLQVSLRDFSMKPQLNDLKVSHEIEVKKMNINLRSVSKYLEN